MLNNMSIPLNIREDRNGKPYHIGRIQFPGSIDCTNGVAILIFVSEDGEEEMQIGGLESENATFSKFTKRPDRLKVSLEARQDQYDKTYYVGKFQFPGVLDCREGATFMVFTSIQGSEELQIVANVVYEEVRPLAKTSGVHSFGPSIYKVRPARG